jgi:hypothetical protein
MANIHNRGVANKEIELALDIAFKNLDKDTAKAISWCITKTFPLLRHWQRNPG